MSRIYHAPDVTHQGAKWKTVLMLCSEAVSAGPPIFILPAAASVPVTTCALSTLLRELSLRILCIMAFYIVSQTSRDFVSFVIKR